MAVEAGDDSAVATLEELDRIRENEEKGEEAYPFNLRWADMKPTECAAQYNDVLIKSGMTLGEVVEEIENSETFLSHSINLDWKIKIDQGKENLYSIKLGVPDLIFYDGDTVFTLITPIELPRKEGDAYTVKDISVLGVAMYDGATIYGDYKNLKGFRNILMGTHVDITGITQKDVKNLQCTLFSDMDVELETDRDIGRA